MNETFVLQQRNQERGRGWNDYRMVNGITGREACYLASEDEAFHNMHAEKDSDKVYIRAKRVSIAIDRAKK